MKCDDGAWLWVITTAAGREGDHSQHIVAIRSRHFGRTWSSLIAIEPPGPPEASYVTALKVRSGRIFVFHNYNGDRLTEVKKSDGGTTRRVDTLGHFVFKYSDNLLTERDPKKIRWELLPEGDVGLRPPAGRIAEEQSNVALSDGSLFTTYRTDQNHPAHAHSRKDGRTWTPPAFMTYGPGGRRVNHARAANFSGGRRTAATCIGFTTTGASPSATSAIRLGSSAAARSTRRRARSSPGPSRRCCSTLTSWRRA